MGISAGPIGGKPNPHARMSADNALIYVDNIRDALVKYDPPHADTYRRNAEAYKEKIRQTMAPLQARLAQLPADKRWLVTSEPSPIWPATMACANCICGRSMTSRAPATGAQGYRHHEEKRIPTIFSESTISDKPARQVAREAGAHYGGVLYVDSLSAADGPVPTARPAARHHRNHRQRYPGRDEEAAMNAAQAGLYVDQLTVTWRNGHTALRDASFSVPRGSIAALVGVNGSVNPRCLKR
ncbi:Putative metal ABC transporter substrate-binding protein Hpf [Klebsiella pneumoniae]|nr:Putative metal ABC transporter substrate-binding protein Hpf [Klebsiella pneumoniae]